MLEQIIIVELVILGIYISTREGEILSFLSHYPFLWINKLEAKKEKIQKNNGTRRNFIMTNLKLAVLMTIFKPLFICIPCMSSVYGGLYYYHFLFDQHGLTNMLFFVLATTGLGFLVNQWLFAD